MNIEWKATIRFFTEDALLITLVNETIYAPTLHEATEKGQALATKLSPKAKADYWTLAVN